MENRCRQSEKVSRGDIEDVYGREGRIQRVCMGERVGTEGGREGGGPGNYLPGADVCACSVCQCVCVCIHMYAMRVT